MPTRILRDWTDSDRVNQLSADAERLYVRLIMKADDYGRYFADPRRIKAFLFPLKDQIRETDISRWLAECEAAGLLRSYAAVDKRFLELWNFGQRLRNMRNVHPAPPDSDNSPPLAAMGSHPPPDTDRDLETISKGGDEKTPTPALPLADGGSAEISAKISTEISSEVPTREQAIAQVAIAGIPADFAGYVHADWSSRNGRDALGNLVPWVPYVTKRWVREQGEWRSGSHRGRKSATKSVRPPGMPTSAEIQAYAKTKWSDDHRAMNWAVSFFTYWNDPKRNWQRQGRTIDWPIEFSQQVGKWRSER